MNEQIIILISIIIFLGYVFILTLKGGVEKDITHLYYRLPENLRWITTAVYTICAALFFWVAVYSGVKILLILCSVFFAIVGFNPDVRNGNDKLHVVGAICAILFGVLSAVFELQSWYLGIAFFVFLLAIKKQIIKIKHTTFWVELAAFFVITISALKKKK